ncbi:cell surface spherulin 4 protein [Rutstroemia sp. NJR-2017a BBW]|nr:cell surface spherulin 4 protein [Rutstroemia sp. NJR-2017a BBW]
MVSAAAILLPLYIYPLQGAWDFVTTAVAKYPDVPFNVIINPNSGPGVTNAYPASDFIDAIASLNVYPNVNLLGYVDTVYMSKTTDKVSTEVETYKYWSTYTQKDIHLDGIFFDDIIDTWTTTSSSYHTTIAHLAHSLNLTVTLNPGTTVPSQFYAIADNILALENDYSDFEAGNGGKVSALGAQASKSSVMLNDFSGSEAQMKSLVQSWVGAGVAGVFITSGGYEAEGSVWDEFVEVVDEVNAGK